MLRTDPAISFAVTAAAVSPDGHHLLLVGVADEVRAFATLACCIMPPRCWEAGIRASQAVAETYTDMLCSLACISTSTSAPVK